MSLIGQKWKEKEHFLSKKKKKERKKKKKEKKKEGTPFYGKRERAHVRKSASLKAKLEDSTLCIKLSTLRAPFAGILLKESFAKGIAYFLRGVPGMLHLLGRIRFSKSSRDTAHCEK